MQLTLGESMRKSVLLIASAIALVAGGFAWFMPNPVGEHTSFASLFPMSAEFDFEPPASGSYQLYSIKPAPDGAMLTTDGEEQNLSDILSGRVSLVSFVYLMCGDENGCPLATSTLYEIYDTSQLAPVLHDNVQLLTISFDPERDTVEAIAAFSYPVLNDTAADEKIVWRVLTTENQAALQPILDGFGQVVDRSNDIERLNHLLRMFLVDREGNIRNIYGLGLIDPRLLMTDIETLLLEDGTL